ncbi:MAG TPA: hypothetical protein EYQ18_01720 [Candidatus Handelsmanbacteria bacterium]|nr:hypothetical protein [Candidatus Handelsmanbacteria bacterium]
MHSVNILYLHSHDTGRWIEPYGHPVPTPRLQQLAAEGRSLMKLVRDECNESISTAHTSPTASPTQKPLSTSRGNALAATTNATT